MVPLARPAFADTPAQSDARFFMLLSHKNVATMGDGYQAVAMLVRHEGALTDPAECRKMLVGRNVARATWGDDLQAPLPKGRLAYMVCQALGVKGGLTMRLFGPTERYCLFECQYLELMVGGAQYQHCPGGELVSVIDRADQYQLDQAGAAATTAKAEAADETKPSATVAPAAGETADQDKPAPDATPAVKPETE